MKEIRISFLVQAVLFFSAFYVLFFSPVFFDGKIFPSDGSFGAFFKSIEFWSNAMFAGYPYYAAPEKQAFYPLRLLFSLFPDGINFNLFILSAYVIASSLTAGYVNWKLNSKFAAIVSGLIFGMSGFMMSHLGHGGIIHAACWLPLMIWSADKLRDDYSPVWFVLGSLAVSMSLLAGHPQISLYSLIASSIFILFISINSNQRTIKYIALCSAFIALGFLLSAIQLLPTAELLFQSVRSSITYEKFSTFSLPVQQIAQILFPFLFTGFPYSEEMVYFGRYGNLIEITGYVGILPLFLATIGLLSYRKNRVVKALAFLAIFSFLLAIEDTLLSRAMFEIPVLNVLRAHARWFVIMSFTIAILAGYGCYAIRGHKTTKAIIRSTILFWTSVVIILVILITLLYDLLKHVSATKGVNVPDAFANPALLIPVTLLAIAVLVVFYIKNSTHPNRMYIVIIIFLLIDLGSQAWFDKWKTQAVSSEALIAKDYIGDLKAKLGERHQRIAALGGFSSLAFSPTQNELFNIESITGQGPMMIKNFASMSKVEEVGLVDQNELLNPKNRALNLLAVRYVTPSAYGIHNKMGAQLPMNPKKLTDKQKEKWLHVGNVEWLPIYEYLDAMPRAWLVPEVISALPDQILDAIHYSVLPDGRTFNPAKMALVGEKIDFDSGEKDPNANVIIQQLESTLIDFKTNSKADAFLVQSDIYYPGWQATVDGKRVPIYRTNHILRGLIIPAGEHSIQFVFQPGSFFVGLVVSGFAMLAIIIILFRHYKSHSFQS